MKRKYKNIIRNTLLILVFGYLALDIYSQGYYKADEVAVNKYSQKFMMNTEASSQAEYRDWDDYIAYVRSDNTTCLVFYPGGKVDPRAYIPLMTKLADRGINTVIAEMPFNLAVLDMNAAEKHRAMFDGIENWYIGGHSLGGAMAASYLAGEDSEKYDGLILLGAYSTADLTDSENVDRVLLVTATEDKVMNWEKYEENFANLPLNTTEVSIVGGCHSYFGSYGMQKGDGTPTISWEEQTEQVSNAIADFILEDIE